MTNTTTEVRVPVGFEQLTVSNAAIGFTSSKAFPDGVMPADLAVVQVETDAIRYRLDGLAPTATVGQKQAVDTSFTVYGTLNLRKFQMIRVTNDATVNIAYYRRGD